LNQQLLVPDKKQGVQDYCNFAYWQEPKKNADFWPQHSFRTYLPVYFTKPETPEKHYGLVSSVLGKTPNFL